MTWTLWDLLPKRKRPAARERRPAKARVAAKRPRQGAMAAKYERMARETLKEHGVRVRKWRTSMSGVAWEVRGHDGSVSRFIEAPRPKGPMSAAIFLHEVGHHAIGFNRRRLRCLEELHAWEWALREMERWGLNVTDRVRERMTESMEYAVWKARRRGLKRLPAELAGYTPARWEGASEKLARGANRRPRAGRAAAAR